MQSRIAEIVGHPSVSSHFVSAAVNFWEKVLKKIDLHIHTIPTSRESHFEFDLSKLKDYVEKNELDAIGITNHDAFDKEQFEEIRNTVKCLVLPGIEICLESSHLLLFDSGESLQEFSNKCGEVSKLIHGLDDQISVEQLIQIFGDLSQYLLIPHYDKSPKIQEPTLKKLKGHITAGEVSSQKKFKYVLKEENGLVPVLFSDCRIKKDVELLTVRYTCIDCGELSLAFIKSCLMDRQKVSLSKENGNKLFPIFPDGQMISTGLNVIMGERASGKSVTLTKMSKCLSNVKYIEQFNLVQLNSNDEKAFNQYLSKVNSLVSDKYLKEFKSVINDVITIDALANEKEIESYLSSLKKYAVESEKEDAYAKATLFSERMYQPKNLEELKELIQSVRNIIENTDYKEIVEKHLEKPNLKALAVELIELLWAYKINEKKMKFVNDLVKEIKEKLHFKSAVTPVKDVDLFRIKIEEEKVRRFEEIASLVQKEGVIMGENLQGYRIIARKRKYSGPGEIRTSNNLQAAVSEEFRDYDSPFEYLKAIERNESLMDSDAYKMFAKIEFQILNKDGKEVSGGERSEFRLLMAISEAKTFDYLLIDEPESSFDNIILRTNVNQILKHLSEEMPVVLVTHNNTVGASIKPNYIIYAHKEKIDGKNIYKLYSGYPTDKLLVATDGSKKENFEVVLNCLESGEEAYEERGRGYATLKNR